MPPYHTPADVIFWSTIVKLNVQHSHAFLKHDAIWKKVSMHPSSAKIHLFAFSSKKVWSTVEYVNSQSVAYMQWTPEIPHAPSTILLHVFFPKKLKWWSTIQCVEHGSMRGARCYTWSTVVCVEHGAMRGARCYAWSTMLYATTSSPDPTFPCNTRIFSL